MTCQSAPSDTTCPGLEESPGHVRLSLAAAMTLGFTPGLFHRNARLRCVNLLLTYDAGCKANCSFCGLARDQRDVWRAKKFIRVTWKPYPTEEIVRRLKESPPAHVGRVCVSMITHPRCREDVLSVCRAVSRGTPLPVSLLISPSITTYDDLRAMRDAGANRIGVAIDAASPDIFDQLRGRGVRGPHRWDRYWRVLDWSLEVFGTGMAGAHLICGLGETEKQLVHAMDRVRASGGFTHLFSFFPERGSAMEHVQPPPMAVYRRIQLARWLIDNDHVRARDFTFDEQDRVHDFGIGPDELLSHIWSGKPFETSGCPGPDGSVACNRPYGNEKPGPEIRNFPFPPERQDIETILAQMDG